MKRLKGYVPLHMVILLIVGIVVQFKTSFWQFGFLNMFILSAIFGLVFLFIKNKIATTISTFLCFFFIGVFAVFLNDDTNYQSYYTHHLKENKIVIFRVQKVLKSTNYYAKYVVNVSQIDSVKTKGTILLNIKKDSFLTPLFVEELISLKPVFKKVTLPLNPHQFNYKLYLEKQGIHQQVFSKNNEFLRLKNTSVSLTNSFSLVGWSAQIRNTIKKSLQKYHFKKDELGVISALLLGQRQDISKELISDYSRAGAIHILAVSGLHIGVFLLILNFLFKPLERIKNGVVLKTTIIILLLWMFAFIAGLSASVVRAVTMFTFVAFGLSLKRKKVIEFSLVSSMLFLLIVKPMFLFDVGFQLSYLAVFGIIWMQPKLVELWKPKNRVYHFFWQLFTVSTAAQIGVLPLSIYYFQQFPGLFMLSNFVIIPCLMYILIGGILVIILSLLSILPEFLVTVYAAVISWMNAFVNWISHQEAFLFKEISISFVFMISGYVLIVFGAQFLMVKTTKKLLYFLMSILLLQSVYWIEFKHKNKEKEFIVFQKTKHSIIGSRIGEKLFLQHDLEPLLFKNDYSLKPYRIAKDIVEINPANFNNFTFFSDNNILLVDSLGIYNLKGLKDPMVVLQYSPKINLRRLIKKIKPSQIIADGSNYKSYVSRWENICKTENIPFYDTSKKGAFVLKN